jgi:hypothetical protein
MKKNRDELIHIIIHIYMEMETPYVAILNKRKCHFFSFTK